MGRLSTMATEAIGGINVPFLSLMADDDPLAPPAHWVESLATAKGSHHVVLLQTKRGGHCGWFSGLRGKSWLDQRVVEFLEASLNAESTADRNMLVQCIEERLEAPVGQLAELTTLPEQTLSVLLSSITTLKMRDGSASGEEPEKSPNREEGEQNKNYFSQPVIMMRDYFPRTAERIAAAGQRAW